MISLYIENIFSAFLFAVNSENALFWPFFATTWAFSRLLIISKILLARSKKFPAQTMQLAK